MKTAVNIKSEKIWVRDKTPVQGKNAHNASEVKSSSRGEAAKSFITTMSPANDSFSPTNKARGFNTMLQQVTCLVQLRGQRKNHAFNMNKFRKAQN